MNITTKESEWILDRLKKGDRIQGIDEYNRGVGLIFYDPADDLIHYNYYGSSAKKATPRDLAWLLNIIFNNCHAYDFCHYSEYHLNHIPNSPNYTGIDYSRTHPNAAGV